MALIGGNGGILLAVANSNTYASNGGHDGSNGGAMEFDFYLPVDVQDTVTVPGSPDNSVKSSFDNRFTTHYIATHNWGTYYWGNNWKEWIIQRRYNNGTSGMHATATKIREVIHRGHPSFNGGGSGDGTWPTLTIQDADTLQIRCRIGGDYFNSNFIEIYYLGGSAETPMIGTGAAHPDYNYHIDTTWSE
jgi:hypothetical protein